MDPGVKDKRKGSIIRQVAVLFAGCVLLVGIFTNITQYYGSVDYVSRDVIHHAEKTAEEVSMAVKEYPAYKWLLAYWCEHAFEMQIDYDDSNVRGSHTAYKLSMLMAHQPKFNVEYATIEEIEALPPEDQKLYAEIVYSWLITRVDQIKYVDEVDYLFCVRTEEPYTRQLFVFSAADPGTVRGTDYEQVYPIGVVSEANESQQKAMKDAARHSSQMAQAGNYIDYYSYLLSDGGHVYLIGLTYDQTPILDTINHRAFRESLMAMGYQVMLSVIILVCIMLLVIRPLKSVQAGIRQYKDDKDSGEVEKRLSRIKLRNEIGELAGDVTELAKEMDDYLEKISTITAEKERIGAELSLATEIQVSMLPHEYPPFPGRDEFDIYAVMDPAREVGGDFYDYFLIDDDHLGIVIADVSGKGVPAALFMMMAKIVLKNCIELGLGPADTLSMANSELCEDNRTEMFVTAWVGILEISTGRLTAANAGHEYPALKEEGGLYKLLKDEHGFVLGAMEDLVYREYELQLRPGSGLFLYTDGVPEASDPDNRLFGTDRMLIALNKEPDANPEEVLRNVRISIDEFVRDAEQFDDLTMLCLEYRGQEI